MRKREFNSPQTNHRSAALNLHPNKIYVIFLSAVATAFILILLSNIVFSAASKGTSVNYNQTLTLTDYYIKVDNANYNTKTSDFSFYWYVKCTRSEPSATTPSIYSVFADYSDSDDFFDYEIKKVPDNDYAYHVTVHNVKSNFKEISIVFTSKTADVQPSPEIDEFGNVITYDIIKGENIYVKTVINVNDVHFIKSDDEIKTANKDIDTPTQTDKPEIEVKPVTTVSSSVVTTSPELTATTTHSDIMSLPETTTASSSATITTVASSSSVTTTTVASSPSATTTTVASSSSATTTTKKPTVTTKKSVTTTKKKPVTTTTKKKAETTKPTTTTEKTTTTKATTTTKETTLTPIPLRGLALKTSSPDNTVYLKVGEQTQVTPVFTPAQATNKKVTWSSNREDRAVIDKNGVVTARSPGAVIIKCVSDDGGLSAACMIIVEERSE